MNTKNSNKTLDLKPYLEAVKNHCQQLSKDELEKTIYQMAVEVSPEERTDFLKELSLKSQAKNQKTDSKADQDEIDRRIEDLKESIQERQESIEDGSYYEEYNAWDEYDYDDNPDSLSEEHKQDIQQLFALADEFFISGQPDLAVKIYQPLLKWFSSSGDEGLGFELFTSEVAAINWRETRARYVRSVYETSPQDTKVADVIKALEVDQDMFEYFFEPLKVDYPFLQDIFNAGPSEPPAWKEFMEKLRNGLKNKSNNRAFVLYLEATQSLQGLRGVEAEVRQKPIPVGYLYWLDQLMALKKWQDIKRVAQGALNKMAKNELRKQAASILCLAGEKTKDNQVILTAKREQFYSTPGDAELATWLKEARQQNLRDIELEKASQFLAQGKKSDNNALKVKILLMLGQLDQAFAIVAKEGALGWSYSQNGIGVFFAGLATALTGANKKAATVEKLLERYSGANYDLTDNQAKELIQGIQQSLKNISFTKSDQQKWLAYVERTVEKRVDQIVSNRRRGAYDRAAEVLGALMECHALNDNPSKARDLLEKYRNQKYNRYSALRREIDATVKSSAAISF